MKAIRNISLLFAFSLLVTQCKKPNISTITDSESPVFTVQGSIDGLPFELIAGIDDAFMHTTIKNHNNSEVMEGRLANKLDAFIFKLFSANIDLPGNNGKFIAKDKYLLSEFTASTPLLEIKKEDFANANNITNINWTVDGVSQGAATLQINEPGRYDVCASLIMNTGVQTEICNTLNIGFNTNAEALISHNYNGDIFTAEIESGQVINSVEWFVNDSLMSQETLLSSSILPSQFLLKTKINYDNGAVQTKEQFIDLFNSENNIEDFAHLGSKTDLRWDETATIKVVHNNQTFQAIQNDIAPVYVTIYDIKDYKNNANGEKVKMLNGEIMTQFINIDNSEVVEGHFNFNIGIAYSK